MKQESPFRGRMLPKLICMLVQRHATTGREYEKLSKQIIPRLISKTDEMSADLKNKEKEGHILLKVINEKKTEKIIDKLLKKVVAESVAEYREKQGMNRKAGVPKNAPETSVINSDMPQQKTVRQQQQIGQLVAVYSATIPRKSPDDKIQSSAKGVEITQPITELLPSKISKQELVDKGMNLVNKMLLHDDELRPSELGRVSAMTDIEPPFPTESQKVFIMDQHSAPSDNEITKEESINPKETNSLNIRQQFKEMQETAPKVNSLDSENLQTASNIQHTSEKEQPSEQQNTHRITNMTSDSLKNILGQQTTLEVKLTEKEEDESKTKDEIKCATIDTEVEEISSQEVQMIPLNETSKAETPEKVLPRVQFKQLLSKASEKKDLVVLKLPDESDYCDEFIPPVAHKSFAINANILKIEVLDEDETGEENGEAFETGEWFETATLNSITKVFSDLAKMDSISSYELYSKCELPTKQASESHLPVCDFIPREEDCLSDDVVKPIKQYKSSPGLSLSSGFTDLENIRYLDKFYFPDEFDDTMKQQCSDTNEVTEIKQQKVKDIKFNRKVYGFVMGSDYSHDSLLSDETNPIGAHEINPPSPPSKTIEKKSMFGEKL